MESMNKYKCGENLYDYSAYLDGKYGKPGTPEREAFFEESLEWMRSEVSEGEFNEWAKKVHLYAEA